MGVGNREASVTVAGIGGSGPWAWGHRPSGLRCLCQPHACLLLQVCPWSSYLTGSWNPDTEHAVVR